MPELLLILLVCFVASFFAGVGTGFVGMSAAVAITPILMGFLGMDQFEATAIALGSDVLASLIAAIIYGKNKNINIKNGLVLLLSVLLFTIGGTIAARYVKPNLMKGGTIITIFLMGLKLLIFPTNTVDKQKKNVSKRRKILVSIFFGAFIGFICGFVGAGGGMMLLLCLTMFLGYELHMAVGTSVFVMTFSALIGCSSHILTNQFTGNAIGGNLGNKFYLVLGLCMVFTLIFSFFGSRLANKMKEKSLNICSGLMLLIISIAVFYVSYTNYSGLRIFKLTTLIILDVLPLLSLKYIGRGKKNGKEEKSNRI